MGSTIIEQDFPYDILHRGQHDAERHNKRVQDAVKKQLKDIISQQDIITSDGNKKVKVRLKYLDQYRFIKYRDHFEQVGRDQFDELEDGETIFKPEMGKGSPNRAGDAAGEPLYEAEYTVDELTDLMIEDLDLPDLDETKKNEIISEVLEYTDRRKGQGIAGCLDKKHSLLAYLKRKSRLNKGQIPVIPDDLRFRTWNITQERHSNAVIFLMMDRSGSMWEEKIYAVKALYFWIVQFLRKKYDRVEIRFIAHDVNAYELNEKEFFTIADSGGTKVSAAYKLCRDTIRNMYSSSIWNIYCFHASDGDSWNDEDECMDLVDDILDLDAIMFCYTEINLEARDDNSTLLEHFEEKARQTKRVILSQIVTLDDIMGVLQTFLKRSHRSVAQ